MKQVAQVHRDGCFIACVASILGITYWKAFDLIHPSVRANGQVKDIQIGEEPEKSLEKLAELIDYKPARARRIKNLRRNALLLIRWHSAPTILHAVVYDAKRKKLIDPEPHSMLRHTQIERQLDTVLYLGRKRKQKKLESICA